MAYFVLALCLIGALLLAGRLLLTADPRKLAKVIRYTVGSLLAIASLALFAFGRPLPAGLLGMGALLAFGRQLPGAAAFLPGGGLLGLLGALFGGGTRGTGWRPGGGGPGPDWRDAGSGAGAGRSSQVETAWLRMALDHDTGEMSGTVLKGRFRGRRVESLAADELIALLRECEVEDPQSVSLLEAYLDRAVGPGWRQRAGQGGAGDAGAAGSGAAGSGAAGSGAAGSGAAGSGASSGSGSAGAGAGRGGRMSVREAREVLGVGEDATPEQIREAHRRLMRKLHPDLGGSNYLAGKINEAKDVLLGT